MPDEKMGFQKMLDELGLVGRGVVYAGAHRGENVPELRECGFEDMLLVEPNADHIAHLRALTTDRIKCAQVALTDREGPLEYWAAPGRFSVMNSILEPDQAHFDKLFRRANGAPLDFEKREVVGTTLDALLGARANDHPYNFFYLNVQGAVLPALKGAQRSLARFEVVGCEAETVSRYRNAPLFDELNVWMGEQGFVLRGLSDSEDPDNPFGMACFARA